ncbi:MAG TPA: hypothetical protein VGE25_00620 [Sediminibacterium sp.]
MTTKQISAYWIGGLACAALLLYSILYYWAIPFSASLTVPQKWKRLPLRENRFLVHGYLGPPASSGQRIDTWQLGMKGHTHTLKMFYSKDSTAIAYTIHYQYSNIFISRNYLLDSNDIR